MHSVLLQVNQQATLSLATWVARSSEVLRFVDALLVSRRRCALKAWAWWSQRAWEKAAVHEEEAEPFFLYFSEHIRFGSCIR